MTKWRVKKRTFAAIVLVAGIVGALAATAVAQSQRFPDVPPEHEAYEAVEWAADVELTTGYTDGTFKPEQPLSKRHAVVFMERFYDNILGADQSDDFTRGDMMILLKAINDGGGEDAAQTTTTTAAPTTTISATSTQGIHIVDHYWSADGEHYYVVVGGVQDNNYCEVHMTLNDRRTGDWGNELWNNNRSEVTVRVGYVQFEADGFEVECS